ncbi:hypothetical protein [Mesorhizobium sp. B2-6-1]|uniref:hypothetical protein n=1 Tax=Mesorhizobium sp. B2-6-1 TaxID=2589916 RepID=UPI0011291B2F|nr:hypothetical protein [Mesorhizobium sp. B2-6-1]TPJ59965.1 hypothetical protein FJ443_22495 [Mesorhizobium sp. B2-6-1]
MTLDEIRRRDWVATYPTREAALALVKWIKADDWETTSQLDRRLPSIGITWTEDFCVAAERCWEVYGYPEMEPVARARRIAEAFMRPSPSAPRAVVAGGSDGVSRPSTPAAPSAHPEGPQTMSYGFTPPR